MISSSIYISTIVIKVLQVIFTGSIKFFAAPFLAMGFKFNFIQIFVTVAIGGILGVVSFYILSEWLIELYDKNKGFINKFIWKYRTTPKKPKRVFTKRNRIIVNVIKKYGLLGLVILTPVLLTIPLGTFLTFKYFHNRENVLLYLSYSVLFWAFILSGFVSFFIKKGLQF